MSLSVYMSQMAVLPSLGRPLNIVLLTMPFFKNMQQTELISLNLSVYEGLDSFCIVFCFTCFGSCSRSFGLFLLVIPNPVAFLLNVTSTVMFWMSACQSILCTVHLTWSLCRPGGSIYDLCGCVVDWLTSNLPQQCSPHDILTCAYAFEDPSVVSGCAWLLERQSVRTKFLRKTKRTAVN